MSHSKDNSSQGNINSPLVLVSLIIPMFNEVDVISSLAERLEKVLSNLRYQFEIVVVDDGSDDGTLEKLEQWQEKDHRLVIVKLSRNWGHQNAFNAGLDIARGKVIIFMDGDLEDPPEVIPELLMGWEEGFNTVYTVKVLRYQKGIRRILTNFYYWLIKVSTRYGVEPQAGMFSLIDEKVASVLRKMKEANKSYPNLRAFSGFKQKQVRYSRQQRTHGKPKQTLGRLITDGLNALFSNTYLPIRVFTVIGLLFTIVFIFIGLIILGVRITGIEFWIFRDIPGTQMIVLFILTLGALQITFLGVLGEYIARIYEENKGRPYYLIDEIKRFDGK
jgi:dolichol-phosphate mannosyltransferase